MLQFTFCVSHDTCKALLLLEPLPGERQIKGNYIGQLKFGLASFCNDFGICCMRFVVHCDKMTASQRFALKLSYEYDE